MDHSCINIANFHVSKKCKRNAEGDHFYFSYDMRGKHSEKALHWKDQEVLNERAFFRTATEPATLSINHVQEKDEGEYRCRVDFTKSPTRNSRIHLTVIGMCLARYNLSRSQDETAREGLRNLYFCFKKKNKRTLRERFVRQSCSTLYYLE